MAFKWLTQYNSPNYTPASRVQATWGQPRTVKAIAIHWWGDPNQNPSFENVVSYLCRPGGGSSAHIVATGTGRKVACLVNLTDASWATNSANPYTISIECDPRCRDEDYDVVAEVIAQIRSIYGNIPLVPHKQFVATACPGNYSLARLNKIAATKSVSKSDAWGKVKNKAKENEMYEGHSAKFWYNEVKRRGVWIDKFAILVGMRFKKSVSDVEAERKSVSNALAKVKDKINSKPTESPSNGGFTESDRTVLQDIKKLLQSLSERFSGIFK